MYRQRLKPRATIAESSLEPEARRLLLSAQAAEFLGNYDESHKLCTEALSLGPLQASLQGEILVVRGRASYFRGKKDDGVLDWTTVIEVSGAPVDPVAKALVSRGVVWNQKRETDKALVDYTRVIEQLPGAPVDQVSQALVNRGVAWNQKGDTDKALADYTRVIEQLPGAPVDHVAQALGNRGWLSYKKNRYSAFLVDTEAALRKQSALDFAAFNLGLALLACGRDAHALAAYQSARERFPQKIEAYGLADLEEAKKTWLSEERARPMVHLLQSLKE